MLPDHYFPDECASERALEVNPEDLKKKKKKKNPGNTLGSKDDALFVNYYYFGFWKLPENFHLD